jgi:ribonuclease HI
VLAPRGAAVVAEAAVWLGHATCNVAEYNGLVTGLALAQRAGVRRLLVQGGALQAPTAVGI